MKLKRSRLHSDSDGMDMERDSPAIKKQVRFGPCTTIPSTRQPFQTYVQPKALEDLDTVDGIPSSSTSPPKLGAHKPGRRIHKLRYRTKTNGGSPLKKLISSSKSTALSSIQDVDMDTGMDADTEDLSDDGQEVSVVFNPHSSSPTATPSIKFSFLVSDYEHIASTDKSRALLVKQPSMAFLSKPKFTPIESQIAVQINRGKHPILLEVREFGSFTEEEREDVRRRFGVENKFTLVMTRSRGERDLAMRRLVKEGLYFGAPDLKVQVYSERDLGDVEMSGGMEGVEESPGPFSDMTPQAPKPSLFQFSSLPTRPKPAEVSDGGSEDHLSDSMKKMDISGEEGDVSMS